MIVDTPSTSRTMWSSQIFSNMVFGIDKSPCDRGNGNVARCQPKHSWMNYCELYFTSRHMNLQNSSILCLIMSQAHHPGTSTRPPPLFTTAPCPYTLAGTSKHPTRVRPLGLPGKLYFADTLCSSGHSNI